MCPGGSMMNRTKELLTMRSDELERYQIVCKALDRTINQREAAECLGLSHRQVRRIIRRVRVEGQRGVIHRLRGRPGCRKIPEDFKQRILRLYRMYYPDFGPTLASEKLRERHRIRINDETLRLWLIRAEIWKIRKHSRRMKFTWRARKNRLGEMVQMDGSHHDWLEGRGPQLVLMGYIDDATGKYFGRFYDHEGTQPAMMSLKDYIKANGLPRAIYLDKHSTYKVNRPKLSPDNPFKDKEGLTQFGRACKQLGIRLIYAHSPQAKGRIERSFETHQDRLVKELRLEGARTCQEANRVLASKYLKRFNNKFRVPALKPGDLHRMLDPRVSLEKILSTQTPHVLRNDMTVIHSNKWYQVTSRTYSKKVTVHEHLNGRMSIQSGTKLLAYKPIQGPPIRPKHRATDVFGNPKRKDRPVPAGPKSYWRRSFSTLLAKNN